MRAHPTATIIALFLTAVSFASAQSSSGRGAGSELLQLRHIIQDVRNLDKMVDRFVSPLEAHGFNPQPDPPGRGDRLFERINNLLPAVQRMINFTYEQSGDERYLQILQLLEHLQGLLRQYEAAGDGSVRTRLADAMAVDMFNILRILDVIEGELIGLL